MKTQSYGLLFANHEVEEEYVLVGYSDSDYAANLATQKSQSPYIFKLYGTAVSWKSNLQSVVALSTTEAEYIALAEAVKEEIWLKGIMKDFRLNQSTKYSDYLL